MILKMRAGVAFIALAICATGVAAPVQPARAQGLLEFLFKDPAQRRRDEVLRKQKSAEEAAARVAPVRIAGPSYKTYVADRLVNVDFSKIADPVVTGALKDMGLPVLGIDAFAEGREGLAGFSVKSLPEAASAVIAHYSSHPNYIWVAGTGVNDRAKAAIDVLKNADEVGLSADDYAVTAPADSFDVSKGAARQGELMRFEMALSVAVANYMLDATRGRIDPNRISGYHDFKRKSPDLERALGELAAAPDVAAALAAHNPQGEHFAALVKELKALKAADEGERITIADDLFLKPGQSDPELANVFAALRLKASDALKAEHALLFASYAGKPEYDSEIAELVKGFQKENKLSADGIIGRNTIRALVGVTSADKITKVQVAMEQARWLPGVLESRRVFINQPAFMATYYNHGKAELSMRVIVGTKANQTYFFDDEIETVEVNPYWGVPQSILINEMLPKLRRDPSYLDRLGYEVTTNGRAVSSSAINWNAVGKGNNIGVRQPPSNGNALGELKILFPNSHAIYMHDTPTKPLFNKDARAFSHGCVRLQNPREMAAAVLGTSVAAVGREIAGGMNKAIDLPSKVPIHVAYFTAWPNEAGQVEYFHDVYGRDDYVVKALDATSAARTATN